MQCKERGHLLGLGVFHKRAIDAVGLAAHDGQAIEVAQIKAATVLFSGVLDGHIARARSDFYAEALLQIPVDGVFGEFRREAGHR